ncbi:MAG: sugar phosphate isomerase/epimerase family protein [Nitrososphaerales archaeon]
MDINKLSISEITTINWDFEQDVKNYSLNGIKGIGVFRDKIEKYGIEKGIRLLNEFKMHVAEVSFCGLFTQDSEETLKGRMKDAIKAIELTSKLKADCLLVVTGPIGKFTQEDAIARVKSCLKELIPVAEKYKVKLALEPIHPMYRADWTIIHTLKDALDMVEEIDSKNLGIFFDVYHLWWERDLYSQIKRASEKIFGVHINDWREKTRSLNDRTIMGYGIIPLKSILSAIKDTGYDGFYEVEIFSDELWKEDPNWLINECKKQFEKI